MAEREVRYGPRIAKVLSPEDYLESYRRRENWVSPWHLVRENRIEEALEIFRKDLSKGPEYGIGMGQVLMRTGQYEAAIQHFEEAIGIPKRLPMRNESAYAFLGAARWCLGDYASAFQHWRNGINAPYAVGGICTETPLLLVVGSILRPDLFARTEAERILKSKVINPPAGKLTEHWPACLGKLVLGTIPKEAMAAWWVRTTNLYEAVMELDRPWLTHFYETALDLGGGRIATADFIVSMRQTTDESTFSDWGLAHWEHLMRRAEFYIARFEGCRIEDSRHSRQVPSG